MEFIFGTTNPAKLEYVRSLLAEEPFKITGLTELGILVPPIDESGRDPLENARIKASALYRLIRRPLFSCDSGLYFDNMEEKLQPGTHVRRVNGKVLNDDEMISYYSGLARRSENGLIARYRNAICLIFDENTMFQSMDDSLSTEPFLLTSEPHGKRIEGFPLDSLSVDLKSGGYYNGRLNDPTVKARNGYRQFFQNCLLQLKQKGQLESAAGARYSCPARTGNGALK